MTDRAIHPAPGDVTGLTVFVNGRGGGNPVPLVADARGMAASAMQAVARAHGHESAFILPATDTRAQWRLRFFVPEHEMEMCGHATVGSLWALRQWGSWTTDTAVVETASGLVDVNWDPSRGRVWISQPAVQWSELEAGERGAVAGVLGIDAASAWIANATTSRTKTLVALDSVAALDALSPRGADVAHVCGSVQSTGLYPWSFASPCGQVLAARQFPKASGYPEDAATGIAAAALWGYLHARGKLRAGSALAPAVCVVRQGEAMGRPSAIELKARFGQDGTVVGCWLTGAVAWGGL